MVRFLTWLRDLLLSVLNGVAKFAMFIILIFVVVLIIALARGDGDGLAHEAVERELLEQLVAEGAAGGNGVKRP